MFAEVRQKHSLWIDKWDLGIILTEYSSLVRLLISSAVVPYDALNDFIGHYSKRWHKFKEWDSKKNGMNLYVESSGASTMELLCENS